MAKRCILIKQDGSIADTLILTKGTGERKNVKVWISNHLRFGTIREIEAYAKQLKLAVSRKSDF